MCIKTKTHASPRSIISMKSLGLIICTPWNSRSTSRSLSPVTRYSHFPSLAAASTTLSSGSRQTEGKTSVKIAIIVRQIRNCSWRAASSSVKPNLFTKVSLISSMRGNEQTTSCRVFAMSHICRHRPGADKIDTQTLASKSTRTAWQGKDFFFRHRAFSRHPIKQVEDFIVRCLKHPSENFVPFLIGQFLDFRDNFSRAHAAKLPRFVKTSSPHHL